MRSRPADLTAILFDGVDKLQHLCWRFLDPASAHDLSTEWEQRVREQCRDYFRKLDGLIAEIVDLAGPESTVVIVSDHGFGPQVRTFYANAWLRERGHLAWAQDAGPRDGNGATLGIGQLARHVYTVDWNVTKVYAPMPSGNGIHIVRAGDGRQGVAASEYESFRDRLIGDLYQVTDPETGERVVGRVWKREEIFAGPHMELAPDLTLELTDGGLISILSSDAPVVCRSEVAGTHRPEGVFIARGPGIVTDTTINPLSLLDVAPMVLHSLGLPIPAEFAGKVPVEAFESAALRARPVVTERAAAGQPPPETVTPTALDSSDEEEIFKRLQALGYVE